MITPVKYVRKPLYVDAVQVTADNFAEVAEWCQGEIVTEDKPLRQYIQVRVTNPMNPRQAQAHVDDWVLYTSRGYKVYTPKAFENSFDLHVEEKKVPVPDEVMPDAASGQQGADEPRFEHSEEPVHPEVNIPQG